MATERERRTGVHVAALLALPVSVVLLGCNPPHDHGWRQIGVDGMPEPGRVYVHPAAYRKRGEDLYVTYRVVKETDVRVPMSDRAHPQHYRTALLTQHIDCANRRVRLLGMQFFDQEGRAIESPPALKASIASATLHPIVNGSIADEIGASTCWSEVGQAPPSR